MKSGVAARGKGRPVVRGRISFVIPMYRNHDKVYVTLDSLFSQDYPDIELIFTDDGSPEWETALPQMRAYVEAHAGKNITRVVYSHLPENRGTVENANNGYRQAEGEYLKDMSPEDWLADGHSLSRYVELLEQSGCLIGFSRMEGVDMEGRAVRHLASTEDDYESLRRMTPEELRNRLFVRNCLPAPAWFAKTELFRKHGYYQPVTRLIEDYPYWIHLCSEGVKMAFWDDVLVRYRLSNSGGGNYSVNFMKDMFALYDACIFPLDRRYGALQPLYNRLKRAGLGAYMDRARWDEYSAGQKALAWIRHGIFFAYIDWGDARVRQKNEKEAGGSHG